MAVDGECDARARGGRMLRESGYRARADHAVRKAMAEHDAQLHSAGKSHVGHTHLKLRRGGKVGGKETADRPDRRARGGKLAFDQPDDDMGNNVKDSGRAHGGRTRHRDSGGATDAPRDGSSAPRDGSIGGRPLVNALRNLRNEMQDQRDQDQERAAVAESRARGGKVGPKKVQIIVNAGPKGDPQREQMAHQAGMQQGLAVGKSAGPGGAPRPPMPPPGAGVPPGGAGPMAAPQRPPMGPPGAGAMPQRPMPPPGAGMMSAGGMVRRDQLGRSAGGAV